jgi:hypothetical protein
MTASWVETSVSPLFKDDYATFCSIRTASRRPEPRTNYRVAKPSPRRKAPMSFKERHATSKFAAGRSSWLKAKDCLAAREATARAHAIEARCYYSTNSCTERHDEYAPTEPLSRGSPTEPHRGWLWSRTDAACCPRYLKASPCCDSEWPSGSRRGR